MILLWQLLIPSWTFFDRLGSVATLYCRWKTQSQYGDWKLVLEKPKITFKNLFINAEGNAYLYNQSLVQRLAMSIALVQEEQMQNDEIEQLLYFKWVENLVYRHLKDKNILSLQSFQFKIQIHAEKQLEPQDFLISKELPFS